MAYPDLEESNQVQRDRYASKPVVPNGVTRDPAQGSAGQIDGPPTTSPQTAVGPITQAQAQPFQPSPGPDLDTSNQVQRDRYASRPVVPNAPEPTEPYTAPDGMRIDPSASIGGVIRGAIDSAGNAVGNALGAFNNYARPDSPSAQSYRARTGAPEPGGVISSAVAAPPSAPAAVAAPAAPSTNQDPRTSAAPPPPAGSPEPVVTQSALTPRITRVGNSFTGVGTPEATPNTSIEDANRRARGELTVIRAREAQAAQDNNNQMRADARLMQSNYDVGVAQKRADFDKFRAQNSADVVLAGGGGMSRRRYAEQAAQSAGAVMFATQNANDAAKAASPQRNYVQDAVVQNQAAINGNVEADRALAAPIDRQGKVITNQLAQQRAAQSKQLTDLTNVLATSTDPAARQRASDALLAMHGKDTNGRYRVVHVAGGEVMAPDGLSKIKVPDRVYFHDTQTNKYEEPESQKQGAGAQGPTGKPAAEGEIRYDPVSKKRAQFINGEWVKI